MLAHDPNLLQGAAMKAHEAGLIADAGPHLQMLSLTSDPALHSHTESMDGSGRATSAPGEADIANASKTEAEFNRVLAEYTSAYKQFAEATMRGLDAKDGGLHAGKVVDPGDGQYVYVNNHGFTHKYSAGAWENRGRGCSDKASPIDPGVLAKLKQGPPMEHGQPCGLEGKIVRNKATKEMAWVDVKGHKHVFTTDAWENKSASCNLHVNDVDQSSYEALPTGAQMLPATACERASVDPHAWRHLQDLNHRLIALAKQLSTDLQHLQTEDKGLQAQMADHRAKLKQYVSTLEADKAHAPGGQLLANAVARSESTRVLADSRWYHYWAWVATAVVVITLTARALSTEDPGAATTLIALVALLVILYNVVRWLYDRLAR